MAALGFDLQPDKNEAQELRTTAFLQVWHIVSLMYIIYGVRSVFSSHWWKMNECATAISLLSITLPFRLHDVLLWESSCQPGKRGTVLTTLDRKPRGDSPPPLHPFQYQSSVCSDSQKTVSVQKKWKKYNHAKTVKKIYLHE